MGNPQGRGARLHQEQVEPASGLARRHGAAGISPVLPGSASTFLRPFAPDPLRPFVALMDALTPARSVPAVLGLFPAATLAAPRQQVSLIDALGLPTIPSPTTCVRFVSPRHVTCRRIEPRPLPNGTIPYGNSGLRHSLAGSPRYTGRIEFLIVRTGRSPPVALHPVSRRRSYLRLPSYVDAERTSTSPTKRAFRRTSGGFTPPFGEVNSPLLFHPGIAGGSLTGKTRVVVTFAVAAVSDRRFLMQWIPAVRDRRCNKPI